jgi:hypothetical protein
MFVDMRILEVLIISFHAFPLIRSNLCVYFFVGRGSHRHVMSVTFLYQVVLAEFYFSIPFDLPFCIFYFTFTRGAQNVPRHNDQQRSQPFETHLWLSIDEIAFAVIKSCPWPLRCSRLQKEHSGTQNLRLHQTNTPSE